MTFKLISSLGLCLTQLIAPGFTQNTGFDKWLENQHKDIVEYLLQDSEEYFHRIELEHLAVCEIDEDTCIIYGQYTFIEQDEGPLCFENPHHLFMIKTTDCGKTWTNLAGPGCAMIDGNNQVGKMIFIDTDHGWLTGGGSCAGTWFFMYRTDNGGNTWEACGFNELGGTILWLDSFFFKNPLEGQCIVAGNNYWLIDSTGKWIEGENSIIILETKDGGKNWEVVNIFQEKKGYASFEYPINMLWTVEQKDNGTIVRFLNADIDMNESPKYFFIPNIVYEKK
ncbi:MAG: hypothetical protein JW904_13055 [Spirochaetales bacterium]|nr:hypothetical protein [Spirochaetales bacterium]